MSSKPKSPNIVVVIPAFNEAKRIANVLQKAKNYYDKIIVVDDCSTDNTAEKVKENGVHLVELEQNMGAGYSTRIGCDLAFSEYKADIVVTIDADGQHDPADILSLVTTLEEEKLDIVFGYRREKQNMPIVKRIGNFALSKLSYLLFNIKLTDTLTGFHVFTKEAYPFLRWTSNRYGFVSEFVYRIQMHKLKYGEVAVQTIYNDKIGGMRKRDGIKSIFLMFKWRLNYIKKK